MNGVNMFWEVNYFGKKKPEFQLGHFTYTVFLTRMILDKLNRLISKLKT